MGWDTQSMTNASTGGASSASLESIMKVAAQTTEPKLVVPMGHKKVHKNTTKQPLGQAKQAKSGNASFIAAAASSAQKRQALERKSNSDSKRKRKYTIT